MTDKAAVTAEITEKIGFPLIIKPVNLGSSVGITKVNSADELDGAITLAASFTDRILAEHAITNLREINCSVLGRRGRMRRQRLRGALYARRNSFV